MLEKVEYIQSIFKINADNPYVITDIAEELEKIDSFDDFRLWIKININHYDAQYMNAYQKFTFLVHMYLIKQLELKNAERINKGRKYTLELSTKVRQVAYHVEEHGAIYKNFKTKNGEEAFTTFDKSQLAKVGGLLSAVRLQKSISGRDALADKLEELTYDLIVTDVIEYKPHKKTENNISGMISDVVKKM